MGYTFKKVSNAPLMESCQYRTVSEQKVQRHCSKDHGVDIRRKQRERSMYSKVRLQCLFAKTTDYWIVQREVLRTEVPPEDNGPGVVGASSNSPTQFRTTSSSTSHRTSQSRRHMAQSLTTRFSSAIEEDKARYRQLGEPNHISEITPWLRKSAMHKHLTELPVETVAQSHATPKSDHDDPRLSETVWSAERILQKAEATQDDTYSNAESEEQIDQLLLELDQYLFVFCTALIYHKVTKVYDSAVISFLAVRSTITSYEDNTITFRPEAQIAGLLSKLIYCCRLILLQDAHYIKEFQHLHDIEAPLRDLCQQWVINSTRGPIGVMSDWRLYTMRVGGATIPEALVVWDADGKNLTYGDTRYSISDLATELSVALQEMKRNLHEELCLGLSDIPTFPLRELQDNWSNNQPGYSFIEDPRNFEGCRDWLIQHISQQPD
ncbi:hypothetical protein LTR10_024414 [Elasticomyces elasticus]|uniref:Uncharacterized protein n=1 Tax=Exophiala sideris TaxID=1016849 RepID=A0ABR0IU64_9EURO|nr:hypothetical protein LTR10_024414 [Elasticomyces elasticus]KAK5020803.1 hypothetical protein LTS07_011427 [Exophiala sideris]KAK5022849.1 hypothetical protein LTR13_011402 [Exophiala sideris]KAK5048130.1 hypothetical protein LTR69_011442 [Exophiala sideris]KAK5176020.1 hypothetical protein LTR44_011415 [Eurotiomycetes sp. CCFEE 6388]